MTHDTAQAKNSADEVLGPVGVQQWAAATGGGIAGLALADRFLSRWMFAQTHPASAEPMPVRPGQTPVGEAVRRLFRPGSSEERHWVNPNTFQTRKNNC